ncbi:rab effector MyRIP isoform X2 [Anolis carolinensis]|uniref:rab effector MyRIP isoform X2 n=1 Tax=Anolis carolinensis TaxID=28377 RepID=UPI0002C8959F|nr:PREDICTED: rab effector MyRIP isoform X2 [Anolis carolinensis]|eukprot:XP_008113754.1 PREDICTED: rab effector MyRIP isoform X2 [Anolis carolinensis]
MGRKLDLSGLTEDEAEHVLQVVQRDFTLRKKEEDRLSEMKQKLDEEVDKCSILSKQQRFNERCCMRCCSPFTFFINTKRQCQDCKYNICKNCSSYQRKEKTWLCNVCQQARLLRAQSLEWYYNNVKSRFKRFGSAKVLKNLYRKHRMETGAYSDLLEVGSICEGTIENDGSICGSDSTFYRQSEGHSMMDTLAVALRVAEEAIEEAISKAEMFSNNSLDKQNEARYLRDHKEELIEELATTIVQKIIRKQKNKTEQVEAGTDWPQSRSSSGPTSVTLSDQSMLTFPGSRRGSYTLWRSQSAFSLTTEEASSRDVDLASSVSESLWKQPKAPVRSQKDHRLSALPSWKSVDRLNEPTFPPVLESTDGNWVALQNVTLPHPRMLAKPKSQVFRVLENESNVVSAYDEMGSESEDDYDWNVALNKLRRRPKHLSNSADSPCNTEWAYGNELHQPMTSPSSGLFANETMCSDSETSSINSSREARGTSLPPWIQRRTCNNKSREDKAQLHGELDVNFNPQTTSLDYSDSSESEEAYHDLEKRSKRWKKSKAISEDLCRGKNRTKTHKKTLSTSQASEDLSETDISSEDQQHQTMADPLEEKLKSRLYELAAKMSDSRETSSEEQVSEPRTESENQKSCISSEDSGKRVQDELKKKYSAVSLCNISTEVLKVINATEELIAESTGPCDFPADTHDKGKGEFPLGTDPIRLDEQLTTLEENVYLTAGSVYGLEGQLNELEEAAREINSITAESELADLEDQVATAAAQVHHAERQISDIESRISALTVAGLNVAPCIHLRRKREQQQTNQMHTIDTSRQQRRKLPAPPVKGENVNVSPVTPVKTFNRNFILQGSLTQRTKMERKSTAKDLKEPTIGSAVMY